ncbi:MAG: barstar family protein, partial [Mailhella sp.]|nr:barstar family protein [Mailhella sp.]
MKAMPENIFFADLRDALAVTIHAPSGKEDLLRQIYAGLEMPAEAGLNWDALDEVLHDLSWIRE